MRLNYKLWFIWKALRKVATTLVKICRIFFHVCLISPISCWYVTRLSRHSVRVHEWTAKLSPFSIQGRLSGFVRIMAAKTLKNPYRLQTVTSISKIRKEKLKVTNSVALVMAFLAAESKNRSSFDNDLHLIFKWSSFDLQMIFICLKLSFNNKVDFSCQ